MSTSWGSTLFVEVSSAEPDADPVWVDITDRVIIPSGVELETMLGRATELTGGEPGTGSLLLRNEDDRFTPGNPTSPYYPWWKQQRRIRVREVFGYQGYDLGDGYLEIPETIITAQQVDGPIKLITMTIRWVDVLGRLQNGRRFIGTLAEHIRYHGGPALVGYWPMNDATTPWRPLIGDAAWTFETTSESLAWGEPTAQSGTAQVTPVSADGPPGDDLQAPLYEIRVDTVAGFQRPTRYMVTNVTFPTDTVTVAAGQVMTIVFWVNRSSVFIDAETLILLVRYYLSPTDGVMSLLAQDGDFTWLCDVTGSTTASFVGPVCPSERWTAVALRWGFGPNVVELWTDSVQTIDTLSFSPVGPARIDNIYLPEGRFAGAIKDVQLYIGDADDFTFEDFTLQRQVGLEGYERQTTGERINTVLDFAGFPAGRRNIDPGTAVMSPLRLAGRRAADALNDARDTERGRLFAQGGRIQFHDRIRVHDV